MLVQVHSFRNITHVPTDHFLLWCWCTLRSLWIQQKSSQHPTLPVKARQQQAFDFDKVTRNFYWLQFLQLLADLKPVQFFKTFIWYMREFIGDTQFTMCLSPCNAWVVKKSKVCLQYYLNVCALSVKTYKCIC